MSNSDKPLIDLDNPEDAALAADREAFNRAVGWPAPAPPMPQASGRCSRRLDWSRAAQLIAGGATVEAAALTLGCEPERILRNLRRSARFRHRIDREAERMKLSARLRFMALGEDATRELQRHTHALDPRLLQWLGEKLNLDRELRASFAEQWAEAARSPTRSKRSSGPV